MLNTGGHARGRRSSEAFYAQAVCGRGTPLYLTSSVSGN